MQVNALVVNIYHTNLKLFFIDLTSDVLLITTTVKRAEPGILSTEALKIGTTTTTILTTTTSEYIEISYLNQQLICF
jgi:hypothetical protein